MIPRRHAWLLRNTATLFELLDGRPGSCKLCGALGREPFSTSSDSRRAYHLAVHRRERIVTDEPAPSLSVVGATEEAFDA